MSYSLAASGDLEGLEIWQLAGVDMTMCSYDGQTPIEVVSLLRFLWNKEL